MNASTAVCDAKHDHVTFGPPARRQSFPKKAVTEFGCQNLELDLPVGWRGTTSLPDAANVVGACAACPAGSVSVRPTGREARDGARGGAPIRAPGRQRVMHSPHRSQRSSSTTAVPSTTWIAS